VASIGGFLLTWLVVADTWLRTSVQAEPMAVTVVALVAVGALVVAAFLAARVAVRSATIAGVVGTCAVQRRIPDRIPVVGRPRRCIGGRGARAPSAGGVSARASF
jgi:hypothetical protein